jgi:RNA polymerase sigma factor (sigma-70 family)
MIRNTTDTYNEVRISAFDGDFLPVSARLTRPPFDEDYITALGADDPETVTGFEARFRTAIRAKARHQLRCVGLQEDACQETLFRVLRYFRSGKRLENPAKLPAFVLKVCENVCREMIRDKQRLTQMLDPQPETPDWRLTPEAQLMSDERTQRFHQIVSRLAEDDRDLLVALWEGADREELCRRFDCCPPALRVRKHRALKRLRRFLN